MPFSWDLITNTPWETVILVVCVFFAGIVRGCIGFGFSALLVASTSLFINPLLVVPLLVLLEIVASVHMLFSVWKDTLWHTLLYMTVGAMIGMPIGVYILSVAPQDILKLLVSLIVLVMTLLLISGATYKGNLNRYVLTGTGSVSGLFGGIAAAGGLVVATFLASAEFPVRKIRATMVVFIFIMEIIFLFSSLVADVYNPRIFHTFVVACIPMFLGIILGVKLFYRLDEKKLRKLILLLLSVLSIIGLLRAL